MCDLGEILNATTKGISIVNCVASILVCDEITTSVSHQVSCCVVHFSAMAMASKKRPISTSRAIFFGSRWGKIIKKESRKGKNLFPKRRRKTDPKPYIFDFIEPLSTTHFSAFGITEPTKMSSYQEKQARSIRKEQVAKYLTLTGTKGDATPIVKAWEKAREDAQVAQERRIKANEEFAMLRGRNWSKNINEGIDAFYQEKRGDIHLAEMSHSPLFLSCVSEEMLCVASLSVCV
jgi:hypothetical protein